MYKLTYKGQLVDGFDADQVVGNLAQLLNLKPRAVRLVFFSDRSGVIKILDSIAEVERWCSAFQEAGVYLDVISLDAPEVDNIADQIELELELYEPDAGDEEPDERQYLIRKVHPVSPATEPTADASSLVVSEDSCSAENPAAMSAGNSANNSANNSADSSVNSSADNEVPAEPDLAMPEVQVAEDTNEEPQQPARVRLARPAWAILAILLAAIFITGTTFWLKRSLWMAVVVAPQETHITEAIASSSLFGLLHADIDRVQLLSPATDIFAHFAEPETGFWAGLTRAGIVLARQVDDAWLGLYWDNGQSKNLWVLQGNFSADAWREWLKNNYLIDSDSPEGIIFSSLNENTCEKSPLLAASISNNLIVLGAPELVAAFKGRLQAGAAAEKNLAIWAQGYNAQMISAALFQPGQLPLEPVAMAMGKLSLATQPVQGIYFGLEPKVFPPRVEFNAVIVSDEQQFIADAATKLTAAVAAARTTVAVDWPETLPLYERITVAHNADQVRAAVNLDEQAPQYLQLWIESLLSRATGGDSPAPVIEGERLESNPAQFVTLSATEQTDFASVQHFNESFIAQTSSGPFGIGIRSLVQTEQGDEINLEVNAFNLPNLGRESDNVMLRITDILDRQDQSLLAAGGGCNGILKQPTAISMMYQGNAMENEKLINFTGLQGAKKIMLPAGVSLANVGAVKGIITRLLPLAVERIHLNGPLAGKTLDIHGVQLRFLSAGPSRLQFQVNGNTAALLQVNALNSAGKQLIAINSVRNNHTYNSGKTISIDFQGTIAAAEIIVASKTEQKNYEFNLTRLFPPVKPFPMAMPEPILLDVAGLSALEKDSPPDNIVYPYRTPKQTIAAGPALVALNELNLNGQSFSLQADVYMRNIHPVTNQLSTVRFVISEIEDAAGKLHSTNHQVPIAMEHMGGGWINGKFEPEASRPWLHGQLEMRDRPLESSDAVALWGRLVFAAVADPVSTKVPFQFGMQLNYNETIIRLQRWEDSRLIFTVEGNLPDLMTVKALDDTGAVVSQPAELRTGLGKNTIELDIRQIPEFIEFNVAHTQTAIEFPLEIRML